ncbi:hypothetical protein VTG60DRAFT_3795 [Thermothelomyces hinnuleus]
MDEAARLVSELHDKLAELDGKVAAYRRDMLAEFHKHMDNCLKQYPDHISTEVSRAITASMAAGRYPALNPPSRDAPDSPAIDRPSWDDRKTSPPPFLRHTSGTPKETARDPHAREKEFQGLFTPTYLPLLESGNRALHSPPMSPPPASNGQALSQSPDNVSQIDESRQAGTPSSSAHEGRPRPARSLTDRSTSSVESSGSDSKTRRSALRRSSSSAKGSPRRVRFDFEGEEVFPASSSPQAPVPTPGAESGAKPQAEAETPLNAAKDDSTTEYTGPSLLDVEGEEDLLPKPKKVSSTHALQALSRCPLDEGTTWRLVSSDSGEPPTSKNREEEPAKTNGMNGEKQPENAPGLPAKSDSQATLRATGDGQGSPSRQPDPSPPRESSAIDDDEDNAASDEEFLSIPSRRKPSTPAKQSPFTPPPKPSAAAARNTTTSETDGNTAADDDGLDPLFDFDEDAGSTSSRSQKHQKYLPEAESSDEDSIPGRLRQAARQELRQQQPHQPQQAGEPSSSSSSSSAVRIPPVSPSTALFEHSIGSYMGRSVTAAPIKDPKLYDEIAGMKDVPFLVGSVHDVSEAEAAKLGSYRVSSSMGRRLSGAAPRSFTERLALEEEMERRRAAGEVGDEEDDDM